MTADKLAMRICMLHDQEPEKTLHLCLLCPFAIATEIWNLVRNGVRDCICTTNIDVQIMKEVGEVATRTTYVLGLEHIY